jgi:hypothetical protein
MVGLYAKDKDREWVCLGRDLNPQNCLPPLPPFEVLIQHKRSGRILTAEILLEMEERNLTL